MLAAFPFDGQGRARRLVLEEFSSRLGSTHPGTNAVNQEPFSTSVFEVLTGIFATTTKIGTRGSSSQTHASAFAALPPRPPTRPGLAHRGRLCIGVMLERHPFSGLSDSAGKLLHTS